MAGIIGALHAAVMLGLDALLESELAPDLAWWIAILVSALIGMVAGTPVAAANARMSLLGRPWSVVVPFLSRALAAVAALWFLRAPLGATDSAPAQVGMVIVVVGAAWWLAGLVVRITRPPTGEHVAGDAAVRFTPTPHPHPGSGRRRRQHIRPRQPALARARQCAVHGAGGARLTEGFRQDLQPDPGRSARDRARPRSGHRGHRACRPGRGNAWFRALRRPNHRHRPRRTLRLCRRLRRHRADSRRRRHRRRNREVRGVRPLAAVGASTFGLGGLRSPVASLQSPA